MAKMQQIPIDVLAYGTMAYLPRETLMTLFELGLDIRKYIKTHAFWLSRLEITFDVKIPGRLAPRYPSMAVDSALRAPISSAAKFGYDTIVRKVLEAPSTLPAIRKAQAARDRRALSLAIDCRGGYVYDSPNVYGLMKEALSELRDGVVSVLLDHGTFGWEHIRFPKSCIKDQLALKLRASDTLDEEDKLGLLYLRGEYPGVRFQSREDVIQHLEGTRRRIEKMISRIPADVAENRGSVLLNAIETRDKSLISYLLDDPRVHSGEFIIHDVAFDLIKAEDTDMLSFLINSPKLDYDFEYLLTESSIAGSTKCLGMLFDDERANLEVNGPIAAREAAGWNNKHALKMLLDRPEVYSPDLLYDVVYLALERMKPGILQVALTYPDRVIMYAEIEDSMIETEIEFEYLEGVVLKMMKVLMAHRDQNIILYYALMRQIPRDSQHYKILKQHLEALRRPVRVYKSLLSTKDEVHDVEAKQYIDQFAVNIYLALVDGCWAYHVKLPEQLKSHSIRGRSTSRY